MKYLLTATEEELIGVNSIGDSTANKRYPVEDERRFVGFFDEQLAQHVENDGDNKERKEACSDDKASGSFRQRIAQRIGEIGKDPHGQK